MRKTVLFFLICMYSIGYSQVKLTLQEAVQLGLNNRFDIQIARNQQQILDINNNRGNAGFYPTIAFQAGQNFTVNNTRQEFFSGDVREGNNVNSNALIGSVALDWTIFDGMNMFIQKDRLEKEAARGLDLYQLQVETAILEIRNAFLDIQEIEERARVLRQAIQVSSERKELMQTRYTIGAVSAQALLQANVDINNDSLELEQTLIELKNVKIRLNEALNRAPETQFDIEPTSLETGLYAYEELLQIMMTNNRNISLARLDEQLANLQVKAANSRKLPSLSLGSAYNFNRSEAEIGILRFNRNNGFTYGLSARWNLFDGFRVKNQVQTARVMTENTRLEREQLEMSLKSNLYMMMENMNALRNVIQLSRNNIKAADENVKISMEKLAIGSLTPIELRTAQLDLIDMSFQEVIQKYQLKRLEWELLFLSGISTK